MKDGRSLLSRFKGLFASASVDQHALEQERSAALRAMAAPVNVGSDGAVYLPLLLALQHLRVCFYPAQSADPAAFSRSAALLQGDRLVPVATDAEVDAFLRQHRQAATLSDQEQQLLELATRGWPEDVRVANAGITAFGAKAEAKARDCACAALQENRNCTLGRQLLKMVSAKVDVRKPFGAPVEQVPDVLKILGGN